MRLLLLGIAVLILCGAGCSRSDVSNPPASPPANEAVEPALSAPLAMARTASAVPENSSGRCVLGAQNELGLFRNMTPFDPDATKPLDYYSTRFVPAVIPGFNGGTATAYQAYAFSLADYSGELDFTFSWDAKPDQRYFWLAVADFTLNGWEWHHPDEVTSFHLDRQPKYFSQSGQLYLLVFVENYQEILNWIRIGDNAPPFCGVLTDASIMPRGEVRTYTFRGTFDADGEIANISYDFDGDGIFETDNGTDHYCSHILDSPGEHAITVRATDDEGQSSTASTAVTVNDWQSEPLAEMGIPQIAVDRAGAIHLVYYKDDDYLYYATNATGSWVEERVFDGPVPPVIYCSTFVLTPAELPALAVHSAKGVLLLVREDRVWQEQIIARPGQTPSVSWLFLEFDVAGAAHLAGGDYFREGLGEPADVTGPDYFYYWNNTRGIWAEKYRGTSFQGFYGMALDPAGNAHLAYCERDEQQQSHTMHLWWDARSSSWVEEVIIDRSSGGAMLEAGDDGRLHIYNPYKGDYFWRSADSWNIGPDPLSWPTDGGGSIAMAGSDPRITGTGMNKLFNGELESSQWAYESVCTCVSVDLYSSRLAVSRDGTSFIAVWRGQWQPIDWKVVEPEPPPVQMALCWKEPLN